MILILWTTIMIMPTQHVCAGSMITTIMVAITLTTILTRIGMITTHGTGELAYIWVITGDIPDSILHGTGPVTPGVVIMTGGILIIAMVVLVIIMGIGTAIMMATGMDITVVAGQKMADTMVGTITDIEEV